jgi:hypothetical protein
MNGLVASKTKRESPIILVNIDCELLLAKLAATQIAIIIIVDHIKVCVCWSPKSINGSIFSPLNVLIKIIQLESL